MSILDPDTISRVALLHLTDGSAQSLEDAECLIQSRQLNLYPTPSAVHTPAGQAALLTAAVTGIRTFGAVRVTLPGDSTVLDGVHRGRALSDALRDEGVEPGSGEPSPRATAIVIGNSSEDVPEACGTRVLYASWDGWTATVSPEPQQASHGSNVLTAITAAALAVGEAFAHACGVAGSDAGYRDLELNLLGPGCDAGPELRYAPVSWWLVGLGHLGQAYAWVISHLPYTDPSLVEVTLQDTDRTVVANHSTGVLTPPQSTGVLKTRLVAARLEDGGLRTRILERQLDTDLRLHDDEAHTVALIGVDNLPTRRALSAIGWSLTIDMGLGARAQDHTAISMHRFPGSRDSHSIPSWQEAPGAAPHVPSSPGFSDLDRRFERCGVVTLAGKAIGVPFVGIIAAAFAVTEALKQLHGLPGSDVVSVDITMGSHASAPAARHSRIAHSALRLP